MLLASMSSFADAPPANDGPANDYPTLARVEYVQECINRTGGRQHMYQCACVVDQIADDITYDDFVEGMLYSRYSTLPGERSGVFRDTDEAKEKAKLFRATEESAFRACNLPASAASNKPAPASAAAPAASPAK